MCLLSRPYPSDLSDQEWEILAPLIPRLTLLAQLLGDLSFARGEDAVRVAKGKDNKERVVPMSPQLRRSLKRYLKARDELVPAGAAPPTSS
jgi:integrase